ncbi:hypothetical protein [Limnoglobus roseus]|uniref:Uncharacterized protein n=1 Tax=Limnoglobus roseus TaxID=2598579 RepID=A0A5C1AL99_9BACT|nr:hypothetical protein [Limnoglobus roseus]QEL19345.1 hypothetical protein PX52LOC_06414 [Limnoglobus roseus]
MVAIVYPNFSWPAAGTTSKAEKIAGSTIAGIRIPSGFSGTSLTFLACDAIDGTYTTVKDTTGATITVTVSGAGHHVVLPANFASVEFLKLVSSASEAANTVVKLCVRECL